MSASSAQWKDLALGEVGKWGSGGTPKSNESSYYDGDIPWIRSGDLSDGPILQHAETITRTGLESSSAKWVPADAILIALYGATIGRLGTTTYPVTTNQAVAYCVPDRCKASSDYLFWYLLHLRPKLIALAQGGAQPNISQTILKKQHLSLPPIDEQHRIVETVKRLLRRSKNARKELFRVFPLAERYKQAVLAAAFRGDLTGQRSSTDKNESGQLPAGWKLVKWDEAGRTISGRAFPSKSYGPAGLRLLRPGNLHASGRVVWTVENTAHLPESLGARASDLLFEGAHIVLNLTAQSLKDDFLGRACLSAPDDRFLLNQRIALFEPKMMSHQYCLWVLKSPLFRGFVNAGLNSGSLIQHIHTKQLRTFQFPVAPPEEQTEIVRLIEAAFKRIERLVGESQRSVELLGRLDQATLAKAFRGEL